MELFSRIQAFFLDLDGTCYVGSRDLPFTIPFLNALHKRSIPYLFVTNNSSTTAAVYVEKLRRRGFPVHPEQVLTCGDSTARHLLLHTSYRKIFLVATPEVERSFVDAGFTLTTRGAQAVVLAFDTGITYKKMTDMAFLLQEGLPWYATSPDITCITEKGLTPDVGVFIAGMKTMTGREPVILGKPSWAMVEAGLERLQNPCPQNVAMVGDQLDTDVSMGVLHGLVSILVLSGETDRDRAEAFSLKPDLVVENLGVVHHLLEAHEARPE
jgi:4-nitrophenyl phosphatase